MLNLSAESHILQATKLLLILEAVKKTPRIKKFEFFEIRYFLKVPLNH